MLETPVDLTVPATSDTFHVTGDKPISGDNQQETP